MSNLKTLKLIEYDTWGNIEDGYEVNNLFTIATIQTCENLDNYTDKEICKLFNNQNSDCDIFGKTDNIKIDFRVLNTLSLGDSFIELETKAGKPVGRVEILEGEVL